MRWQSTVKLMESYSQEKRDIFRWQFDLIGRYGDKLLLSHCAIVN